MVCEPKLNIGFHQLDISQFLFTYASLLVQSQGAHSFAE